MVKQFILKSPDEDGSIEAHLQGPSINERSSGAFHGYSPYSVQANKLYPNKKQIRENYNLMKRIKKNPRAFFNFRFGPKEYALFLNKQYFMRIEKNIIHMKLKRLETKRNN